MISIELKELLELLTYNQLISPIYMSTELGAIISLDDPAKTTCFVEILDTGQCAVWYPVTRWYDELRRRNDIENIITKQKAFRQISPVETIQQQIIKATLAGDYDRVVELSKQL